MQLRHTADVLPPPETFDRRPYRDDLDRTECKADAPALCDVGHAEERMRWSQRLSIPIQDGRVLRAAGGNVGEAIFLSCKTGINDLAPEYCVKKVCHCHSSLLFLALWSLTIRRVRTYVKLRYAWKTRGKVWRSEAGWSLLREISASPPPTDRSQTLLLLPILLAFR